jgi:hypothetical protein
MPRQQPSPATAGHAPHRSEPAASSTSSPHSHVWRQAGCPAAHARLQRQRHLAADPLDGVGGRHPLGVGVVRVGDGRQERQQPVGAGLGHGARRGRQLLLCGAAPVAAEAARAALRGGAGSVRQEGSTRRAGRAARLTGARQRRRPGLPDRTGNRAAWACRPAVNPATACSAGQQRHQAPAAAAGPTPPGPRHPLPPPAPTLPLPLSTRPAFLSMRSTCLGVGAPGMSAATAAR